VSLGIIFWIKSKFADSDAEMSNPPDGADQA
jgi:hypothetical protein